MKRWYCNQCGAGPSQAKSRTVNNHKLCPDCFFTLQASEALKAHANRATETILATIPRKEQQYYAPIGQWLNTCCERDPARWTASRELHASYTVWCAANNCKPCNSQVFERLLADHGLPTLVHKFNKIGIQGLHLHS
jgi:hypothetical protein